MPLGEPNRRFEMLGWVDMLGRVWAGSTIVGRCVLCTVGLVLVPVLILTWTLLDLMLYACNKPGG